MSGWDPICSFITKIQIFDLFVCYRGGTYYICIPTGSRQGQHRPLVCLFWSGNLHCAHSPANPTTALQECFEVLDVSNSSNYWFLIIRIRQIFINFYMFGKNLKLGANNDLDGKHLIFTSFCIQIIKGQKCLKPAIVAKSDAYQYRYVWCLHK